MRAPGHTREVVTTRTAPRAALAGVAALALVASATANPSVSRRVPAAPITAHAAGPVPGMLADRAALQRTSRSAHRLAVVASVPPGAGDARPARRLERKLIRQRPAPAARHRPVVRRTASRAASVRIRAVVGYARAQVGDPYVFSGAGPRGFDCSGLTMRSFSRAGVRLPHKASRQSARGRGVSRRAARAGDLVVWGGVGSAYHVGVYLGGGRVVHSPRPGRRVDVAPLWGSPQFRRLF